MNTLSELSHKTRRLIRLSFKWFVLPSIVLGVVALVSIDQWSRYRFGASLHQMMGRHLPKEIKWQREQRPSLTPLLNILEATIPQDNRFIFETPRNAPAPVWARDWQNSYVGPSNHYRFPKPKYDDWGRAEPTSSSAIKTPTPSPKGEARIVMVDSPRAFLRAVRKAQPGDVITLAPGIYDFSGRSIAIKNAGQASSPIIVRAGTLGNVRLRFNLLEGFHVLSSFWVFENLEIEGTCKSDSRCEHAFHIVGNAQGTVIRNNVIKNFNSHLKINGNTRKGTFPDGGVVEYNLILNDNLRKTTNPTTPIDLVGASHWYVGHNFIADFGKSSIHPSYAGFFKGGGSKNLFEQNAIICEFRHTGGVRLGLSLGDGGTGRGMERPGTSGIEQADSAIRNNLIANCPLDVGVYISKSRNSIVSGNHLINTLGVDVRYANSDALIIGNHLDGRILSRNDAFVETFDNTATDRYRFNALKDFDSKAMRKLLGINLGPLTR